jgi:hypothetical protein
MVETNLHGLARSHGQACNGPLVSVRNGSIGRIDHRNQLLDDDLLEGTGVALAISWRLGRSAGSDSVAFLHDNDHRPGLALGDQVVEDEVYPALPAPTRLIFAAAML